MSLIVKEALCSTCKYYILFVSPGPALENQSKAFINNLGRESHNASWQRCSHIGYENVVNILTVLHSSDLLSLFLFQTLRLSLSYWKDSLTVTALFCTSFCPVLVFCLCYVLQLMFLNLFTSGWKNAQLAQQLEERERRIKGHLDIAAKGEGLLFSSVMKTSKPFSAYSTFFMIEF